MNPLPKLHNHIVLMGFKHVGKSVIGKYLAERLRVPFVDVDHQIELAYQIEHGELLNCRQIMQTSGEKFFRLFEIKILRNIINAKPSIISLGGGTPLHAENQRILKPYILVHITAPKGVVFERIRMTGRPAFFDSKQDFLDSFQTLWNERELIYKKICCFSIRNEGPIEESVKQILHTLHLEDRGS